MTIKTIIDGIVRGIREAFGDGYEIYDEDIKQGLQEPCFSVVLLTATQSHQIGSIYSKHQAVCVHYFPSSDSEPRAECLAVAEQLAAELEYIVVDGDLIRGHTMSSEIVDGVLAFVISFDERVLKTMADVPRLSGMEHTTNVEG